ncbi:hypothetical protein [Desulfovibrio sp. UCD-KL4C]|uniref:hypothetical protein n=1 Tax=Desulfovibrio sp. UCD-KL4C TaxID=2578120 RepID=UPI0025BA19CB|nr:hypothetical protein [Desulfovibrio sp. UCD-KL4C]
MDYFFTGVEMVNFVCRVVRILVISVLLIPVYGVLAEQDEPFGSVRMLTIHPPEIRASSSSDYIANRKQPVSHVVLHAEPLDYIVDDGPVYRVAFNKNIVSKKSTNNVKQHLQVAQANASDEGQKKSSVRQKNDSSVDNKGTDSESFHAKPLAFSSVSLLPKGNVAAKLQRTTQDTSFYTTPKRAVGLSGTLVKANTAISVRETYDSNIDYANISDLVTEIKPALTLNVIGEDSLVKLRGDLIYRNYFDHEELNRYDYNINLVGKHNFSPKLDASFDVVHTRFHNLDQNTYAAGGVTLDPSIILTTAITPQLNWRVTEKDNINILLTVDKTDYERKYDSDYLSNVFNVVWGHALDNERTTLFLGAISTYTYYSREIDDMIGNQVTFQNVLGIDHKFTEHLKLSFKGGPGVTISNYSNNPEDVNYKYQFKAELSYIKPTFEIIPSLTQGIRPGGSGENEVISQADLFYLYRFSDYLNYSLVNSVWQIESDGIQDGKKYSSSGFFTQSVFTWKFKEDWQATCGLSYKIDKNKVSSVANERFKTWVGLSYSFPTEIN